MTRKQTKFMASAVIVGAILLAWCLTATIAGYTRLQLRDGATGRILLSALLQDDAEAILTWHNSLFDLDVIESFITRSGDLVQTGVTFADPRGLPPMVIQPGEIDDFYHTGGPFTTSGLQRHFSRIVYRIGEIGNPLFVVGERKIALKQEVGFGGQVILSTAKADFSDFFVAPLVN